MKRLAGILVALAVATGCADGSSSSSTSTSAPSTSPASTSAAPTTAAPTTSTAAAAESLRFTGLHGRSGSLWDIELLGVVAGKVNPRSASRSRKLAPCLALVVHATYAGPEPLGVAADLSLGSAVGGGKPGACIPDVIGEQLEWESITEGTSVIATFGMIEFEEPLPDVVEVFVRDPVADTTEYRTFTAAPSVNLPPTAGGPDPSPLLDSTTPLLHESDDGTVTVTIVGMWPEPVALGTCWQAAATFTVSEKVHAVTVAAVDAPSIVAAGTVRVEAGCGAPAPGYTIDPDVVWYEPGSTYRMGWSYFLPDGVEPQAIVADLAAPEFIAIDFLDGPPPPP